SSLALLPLRGAADLAGHTAGDRVALEVLAPLRRQHLLADIGEDEVVARAAVEDRDHQRAGALGGELTLEAQIGGQIVDGAARRGRRRGVGNHGDYLALDAPIRAEIDLLLPRDTVAAGLAAKGFRLGRGGDQPPWAGCPGHLVGTEPGEAGPLFMAVHSR